MEKKIKDPEQAYQLAEDLPTNGNWTVKFVKWPQACLSVSTVIEKVTSYVNMFLLLLLSLLL